LLVCLKHFYQHEWKKIPFFEVLIEMGQYEKPNHCFDH
jgi:hypothetical protein